MSHIYSNKQKQEKIAFQNEIQVHFEKNDYANVIKQANQFLLLFNDATFDNINAKVYQYLSYAYYVTFQFAKGENIALKGIRLCKNNGYLDDTIGELYRHYALNTRLPVKRLFAIKEALKYAQSEVLTINIWLSFILECSFNAQFKVAEKVIPKLKVKVNLLNNGLITADFYRHLALLYMYQEKYHQCLHYARLSLRLYQKQSKVYKQKLDVKYFQIRFFDIIISIKLKYASLAKEELAHVKEEIVEHNLQNDVSLNYLLKVTNAHYAYYVLKNYELIYLYLNPIRKYLFSTFLHSQECLMLYNTCEILGYKEEAETIRTQIQIKFKNHFSISSAERNSSLQAYFLQYGTEHYSTGMKKLISQEIAFQEELLLEKQKTEELLKNIFPVQTLQEFQSNNKILPKKYTEASVIFIDIKGFTHLTNTVTPEKLINTLNYIFTLFDDIAVKHKVERIKTIGDCYMAVSGVPVAQKEHLKQMVKFAIEILEIMPQINSKIQIKEKILVRIGINSGELIAGVFGTIKYAYDVWGKTVQIAQVLEQSGKIGKINCTNKIYEKLTFLNKEQLDYFVIT